VVGEKNATTVKARRLQLEKSGREAKSFYALFILSDGRRGPYREGYETSGHGFERPNHANPEVPFRDFIETMPLRRRIMQAGLLASGLAGMIVLSKLLRAGALLR
jgi:hypothetical protein